MPPSLRPGDLVEVDIQKLVFGGEGFARHEGRALFVPFTAPGERVRVAIDRVERSWARGSVDAILRRSPVRRTPACAHFMRCGGCHLQHLEYSAQLAAKAEFVREALRRVGKIEWTSAIEVRSSGELEYRSRAELQVSRDAAGRASLGYFEHASHRVHTIDGCPLLAPEVERELGRLRTEPERIPAAATRVHVAASGEQASTVFANERDELVADGERAPTVTQRVGEFDYRSNARAFFQSNRFLVDELARTATEGTKGSVAVDLYAGVGLFSLPLARRFGAVMAVEGNSLSADLLVENARANRIANVKCEAVAVEEWLATRAKKRLRPDLVLLDPPRSGAGERVLEGILRLEPAAITYVSCDPTTLARDLRLLVDSGFAIASLVAFDMFPQTFHVETVVQLEREPD
jgi:23S rRNA (uracil1939-C5)-methyltransferase